MKFSAALFLASSLFAGSVHGQTTLPPDDVSTSGCELVPGTAGTYYCKKDDSLLTWAAAKAEAETLNFECPTGQIVDGRLAIPTTAAEAALMLTNYNARWVGAKQTACTAEAACSWSWLDGQQLPGTSDLWEYAPEPNDGNNNGNGLSADCGFVRDDSDPTRLGFLRDNKCTGTKKYIVEYDCNDLYAVGGTLDISGFDLDQPQIAEVEESATDANGNSVTLKVPNELSVKFTHGPGSNNGATGILLTAGFCPDGDELTGPSPLTSTLGLSVDGTPGPVIEQKLPTAGGACVSPVGSPPAGSTKCETTYKISIDLTETSLDLDENNQLYFCVTHSQVHNLKALNFQQTDVTLTYDLETNSIAGFTFQTAKSSPDSQSYNLGEILAEAKQIITPALAYFVQGELMSWDICPIDSTEMFRTAALVNLKAEGTRDGTVFQQILTTATGASQDDVYAQIFQSATTGNEDCLNIQFILEAGFFAIFETVGANADPTAGPLPVQVSGTVRFTEKVQVARRTLRAENESRQLQTRVTDSDVEMNMVLGVTPDANSGSYLVSVSSFTLLGAAGAALLI